MCKRLVYIYGIMRSHTHMQCESKKKHDNERTLYAIKTDNTVLEREIEQQQLKKKIKEPTQNPPS